MPKNTTIFVRSLLLFAAVSLLFPANAAVFSVSPSSLPGGLQRVFSQASDTDVIQLAPGTYSGAGNYDLVLNKSVTLVGSGKAVIDCQGRGRCLVISGARTNVTVQGVQFQNGAAPFWTRGAGANIRRSEMSEEKEERHDQQQPFVEEDEVFVAYVVRNVKTGETRTVPVDKKPTNPTAVQKLHHKNHEERTNSHKLRSARYGMPPDSHGGCVFVTAGATATFVEVTISGCRAPRGGGIAGLDAAQVTMVRSVVTKNVANTTGVVEFAAGGGVYFWNSSSLLQDTVISDNWLEIDSIGYILQYSSSPDLFAYSGGAAFTALETRLTVMRGVLVSGNVMSARKIVSINGAIVEVNYCDTLIIESTNITQNIGLAETAYIEGVLQTDTVAEVVFDRITLWNNTAIGAASIYGWAISLFYKQNIRMTNILIYGNRAQGGSYLTGGGMRIADADSVVMSSIVIVDNNFSTAVWGKGGGLFFGSCKHVELKDVTLRNNVMTADTYPELTKTARFEETPGGGQCSGYKVQHESSGSLTDGSGDANYAIMTRCTWALTPASSLKTVVSYQVSMDYFNIEETADCSFDSLSFFDGPTTMSPLLGKYCGYSLTHPTCSAGSCPPLSNIVSSGAAMLVVFYVDEDIVAQGFRLNWTTITQTAADGRLATTDEKALTMPDGNLGGGIYLLLCPSVIMSSVTAQGNVARHPIVAAGAGVFLHRSVVVMSNVTIGGNSAIGLIVGGGGLTVFDGSTVTVQDGLRVESNTALSNGPCFSTTGNLVCGRAWGGGTMVYKSHVHNSASATIAMRGNSINCLDSNCKAYGGGLAAISSSTVIVQSARSMALVGNQGPVGAGLYASSSSVVNMTGLVCAQNQATCSARQQQSGASCGWVGGGCVYVDSASVRLSRAQLLNNVAAGNDGGGGGGAAMTGTAAVTIDQTEIHNNTAPEGGALWGDSLSSLSCSGCTISQNAATFVGGGVSVRGSMSLTLRDSLLSENTALRATAVWGYGEHSTLNFFNTESRDGTGSIALILGHVNQSSNSSGGTDSTIKWTCEHAGSVMDSQRADKFYSKSCTACVAGTYNVYNGSSDRDNDECQPCPYGGLCTGSTPSGTGLGALPGYWGMADSLGHIHFYPCPSQYCCPAKKTSCATHDYCDGGRVGKLCGQCPPGMGFRLMSEVCGYDSDCDDAGWASVVVIIIAFIIAIYLCNEAGGTTSLGLESVALFFYQVVGLVKSTPWLKLDGGFFAFVQSISNFSPVGQTKGVCFSPGMTQITKIGTRAVFPTIVLGCVLVIWLGHWLLYVSFAKKRPGKNIQMSPRPITVKQFSSLNLPEFHLPERNMFDASAMNFGTAENLSMEVVHSGPHVIFFGAEDGTAMSPAPRKNFAFAVNYPKEDEDIEIQNQSSGSTLNEREMDQLFGIEPDLSFGPSLSTGESEVVATARPVLGTPSVSYKSTPRNTVSRGSSNASQSELQRAPPSESSAKRHDAAQEQFSASDVDDLAHRMTTMTKKEFFWRLLRGLQPPRTGRYVSAVVKFMSIAYITLSLCAVQLLQCQIIGDELVWWWDASVKCYARWQIGAFVMLFALLPVPFIISYFLLRFDPHDNIGKWQTAVVLHLTGPYRYERRYWEGVGLLRRLLLVLAYSMTTDAIWRAMAVSIVLVVFLVSNLLLHPYESILTHRVETLSLFLLVLLGISSSPALVQLQLKTDYPIGNSTALEWLQMIAFVVPGILGTFMFFKKRRAAYAARFQSLWALVKALTRPAPVHASAPINVQPQHPLSRLSRSRSREAIRQFFPAADGGGGIEWPAKIPSAGAIWDTPRMRDDAYDQL